MYLLVSIDRSWRYKRGFTVLATFQQLKNVKIPCRSKLSATRRRVMKALRCFSYFQSNKNLSEIQSHIRQQPPVRIRSRWH
ncbi:hypothetical protein EFU14_00900 [Vibrio cholerae]|nr:hypothetical protein [Vibrio cholerae]